MRQTLVASLLLLSLLSTAQNRTELLEKAYKHKSLKQLKLFFEKWRQETTPLKLSEFFKLTDTAKNIYSVFQTFYKPKDLDKIGGSEWGNGLYAAAKYLVIQDNIVYEIGDSNITKSEDTLEYVTYITTKDNSAPPTGIVSNFRSSTSVGSSKTVVLTKTYEQVLNHFLGGNYKPFGEGNMMSPATSAGESKKRQNFLENFIKIFHGHWGDYWQLYSYPEIERIRFDSTFTNAIVFYTIVYEHGQAYLQKQNGTWRLLKAERTSIE